MDADDRFPLPPVQYRRYVLFFHTLTLGSLAGALTWVLWHASQTLTWPLVVTGLLLLVQVGIYLGLMLFGKTWPLPQNKLLLYFGANLALWLVETWLTPGIFWIIFAYLGQIFGLLPARYGLLATLFAAGIVFASNTFSEPTAGFLLGWLAALVFLTVLLLYINQVTRTSQDRGELVAELQAAKTELEAAQQREAEVAVLQERERLARDLHDSLGHTLVTLSVQLEAAQRLYRVDPDKASAQIDEMKDLTRSSMEALRHSLAGLRAPGLGDSPLRPALQALCIDLGERSGLEVAFQIDEVADSLRPAVAEALWRITQEALTNIEKHAQARRASLVLACRPGEVTLRVTDDGLGLAPGAEAKPNHYGLRGMRERSEGLGGSLVTDSSAAGTIIEARLPIITNRPAAKVDEGSS